MISVIIDSKPTLPSFVNRRVKSTAATCIICARNVVVAHGLVRQTKAHFPSSNDMQHNAGIANIFRLRFKRCVLFPEISNYIPTRLCIAAYRKLPLEIRSVCSFFNATRSQPIKNTVTCDQPLRFAESHVAFRSPKQRVAVELLSNSSAQFCFTLLRDSPRLEI